MPRRSQKYKECSKSQGTRLDIEFKIQGNFYFLSSLRLAYSYTIFHTTWGWKTPYYIIWRSKSILCKSSTEYIGQLGQNNLFHVKLHNTVITNLQRTTRQERSILVFEGIDAISYYIKESLQNDYYLTNRNPICNINYNTKLKIIMKLLKFNFNDEITFQKLFIVI